MLLSPNKTVSIYRLTQEDGQKQYNKEVVNWIQVYIEPISDKLDSNDWSTYFDFKLLTDYSDIQISDKLIDNYWNKYIVKMVKSYESFIWNHLEVQLKKSYD